MDRETELAHLKVAERIVAESEQHILRQEELIAELDRDGHDTRQARELLATYWRMHEEHVAHRDLILKMLGREAAKVLSSKPIFQPGHYDDGPREKRTQTPAGD